MQSVGSGGCKLSEEERIEVLIRKVKLPPQREELPRWGETNLKTQVSGAMQLPFAFNGSS